MTFEPKITSIHVDSSSQHHSLLTLLCPAITGLDILKLLRNAIDQAFCSKEQKKLLLASHIPFST